MTESDCECSETDTGGEGAIYQVQSSLHRCIVAPPTLMMRDIEVVWWVTTEGDLMDEKAVFGNYEECIRFEMETKTEW